MRMNIPRDIRGHFQLEREPMRQNNEGVYYNNARELRSGNSLARERDVAPTPPPPRALGTRFVRQECPGIEFWQDHGQRQEARERSAGAVHCCLEARWAKIQSGMLGGRRALGRGSRDG